MGPWDAVLDHGGPPRPRQKLVSEWQGSCRRRCRDVSGSWGLSAAFLGDCTKSNLAHLPALGETTLLFSLQAISLTRSLNSNPNHPDLSGRVTLCLALRPMLRRAISAISGQRRQVWRHLRGSVLPSVDLAQDVSQHKVPLPPSAAPAAVRRNTASLMVRIMRSAK